MGKSAVLLFSTKKDAGGKRGHRQATIISYSSRLSIKAEPLLIKKPCTLLEIQVLAGEEFQQSVGNYSISLNDLTYLNTNTLISKNMRFGTLSVIVCLPISIQFIN